MTHGPERVAGLRPQIELDGVQAALGGPTAVPADMQARLAELVDQVLAATQPGACLWQPDISGHERDRVEAGGQTLRGLGVAGLLEGSQRLAAFTVSLGPGPEALMEAANQEGRLVDLTLLDAISSEAVEDLADQVQAEVERRARAEDRASTRRYSPGYCDWALEQQAVFQAWDLFGSAGIRLTDDFLMLPEKSVSAIMGVGPTGTLGGKLGRPPACKRCPLRADCPGPG